MADCQSVGQSLESDVLLPVRRAQVLEIDNGRHEARTENENKTQQTYNTITI